MAIFDVHTYLEGYSIPGINQNGAQLQQTLRSRGVDRAVVMSTRAASADPISGNRILKGMLDQSDMLYGGLVAHLNRVDASLLAIRELMGNRKFLCVMLMSTHPEEPLHPLVADEVLNACRRFQKPIFLQTPNATCIETALHLASTYNMHQIGRAHV